MACKHEQCECVCSIRGLAHIGVFVKDIEVSKKFYQDILRFECFSEATIGSDDGDVKVAFLRCGSCELELVQFPVAQQRSADGVIAHIALDVDDIDAVQACLENKGIQFETEKPIHLPMIFDNGVRYINLAGPDGEVIELNQTL